MPTYEERQSAALSTTVAWLEDELREAKTLLVKQQQALDQFSAQLWEVTTALHRAEDLLGALPPRLEVLPVYDAQIRRLKDDQTGTHEAVLGTEARLGELARLTTTESERARAVLNELIHRVDATERGLQGALPRFDALDESTRRSMDAVTGMRQRVDEVERHSEGLVGRLARVIETGAHTEQEFARLSGEIETLRHQDATLGERVQVYTEMLKRLDAQISILSSQVEVKQDVLERIDLARVELHRLEGRTSVLEALTSELHEADDGATRQIARAEGRDKGYNERLIALQSELAAYRGVVAEQFQRVQQTQERIKRRQIEDLEREIREMRIHAYRPVEHE